MYHAVRAPVPPHPLGPPSLDLRSVPEQEHLAAREYNNMLDLLTSNSKEVIDNLTMIAGENLNNANGIVHVIERRILSALPMSKLLYLYLADSILKNVGSSYIHKFSINLYNIFRNVYSTASPTTRASLHRLLNTWPSVFGPELVTSLRAITVECDNITANTATTHSHVTQGYNVRPMTSSRIPRVHPSREVSLAPNYQNVNRSHPTRVTSQRPVLQPSGPQNLVNGVNGVVPTTMAASIQHQVPPPQSMGMPSNPIQSAGMHSLYHQGLQTTQLQVPQGIAPGLSIQGLQGLQGPQAPAYSTNSYHLPQQQTMPIGPIGAPIGMPDARIREGVAKAEQLMADITRKRALGVVATNDEIYLNSLLAEQLRGQMPYPEQMRLLEVQRRLNTGSVAPSQTHFPVGPRAVAPTPSLDPGALSNLARSLPSTVPVPRTTVSRPLMKFAAVRTASHTSSVRALYTDLPHLSKSDGMRFATKAEFRAHLDWLFVRNRRKRARDRDLPTGGGLSRCWYDHVDVFVGEKSNGLPVLSDKDSNNTVNVEPNSPDPLTQCVDARGDDEICPACREGFIPFWDDDKQKWRIKEAVRNRKGTAFHTRCAASINDLDAYEESQLTPASSTKALPVVSKDNERPTESAIELFADSQRGKLEIGSNAEQSRLTTLNTIVDSARSKDSLAGEDFAAKILANGVHYLAPTKTSADYEETEFKSTVETTGKRKAEEVIGDDRDTLKRAKVENVENVQVVAGK